MTQAVVIGCLKFVKPIYYTVGACSVYFREKDLSISTRENNIAMLAEKWNFAEITATYAHDISSWSDED